MRIGIDLGGTKIEGIALDNTGMELFRRRIATPQNDYTATLEALCDLVQQIENYCNEKGSVGIGIPGAISPATNKVKNANSTWLIGQPMQQDLEAQLSRPVRIANDANCFTVSEATDGAGCEANVVFGVIIGTGTGAGICINRQPLVGCNAIGGEWGHNPLPWPQEDELPGRRCYCGKQGCIETWLSGPGFTHAYQSAGGQAQNPQEILEQAEQGNKLAEKALRDYENRLARALASIINVLDPDVIILGGGMGNIHRLYKNIPEQWAPYIFSDRVDTRLLPPAHGDSSGVRGAAWLWPK